MLVRGEERRGEEAVTSYLEIGTRKANDNKTTREQDNSKRSSNNPLCGLIMPHSTGKNALVSFIWA